MHATNPVRCPQFYLVKSCGWAVQAGVHAVESSSLYGNNQGGMANLFGFLDADNNGQVSREEWIAGCEWMNAQLDEDQRVDPERCLTGG